MQTVSFRHLFAHRNSIIALYRSLIRHSSRLSILSLPQHTSRNSKAIENELVKASLDHDLYVQHVKAELNYIIREEFRNNHKTHPDKLRERIVEGIDLENILDRIGQSEFASLELIQKLVNYRQKKHLEQSWKAEYLKHPEEINKRRNKSKPTLLLKQIASRSEQFQPASQRFSSLSQKDKVKRIKTELKACDKNTQKLLRRYLKKLQTNHEIPIPHLLPYTPESSISPIFDAPSLSLTIPGSTRKSSISHAYDQEYIDGIIKPGLEFDINKFHYLEHLQSIVNDKGPFKVQIELTEAGPIAVPYIRLPYPRLKQLQEVALDIKKMMRLVRLKAVWNSSGNDNSITEACFSDGSYGVRGSKGFGSEERIHSKAYYEKLAQGEGLWEYLIDNVRNNQNIKSNIESYTNEWLNAIDVATDEVSKELNSYYQKYSKLKSSRSPLLKEQKILQDQMNLHYNDQVNRYKHILLVIEKNKVFKHSEIVNLDVVIKLYDEYLVNDSGKLKKSIKGIPSLERIGMGKGLGDYLDAVDYHYFKFGMNFDKKLKF